MTDAEARNIERFRALGNTEWRHNWTPLGGRDYVEAIRHEDQTVWLCQQSMSREAFDAIETPKGWSVRDVTLEEDLLVEVPYPARVCFFDTGDSWPGPVRLDLPS